MTSTPSRNDLPPQILEEAASWFIEFNEAELDIGQRTRFNEWIRRSPEHLRAYFEIGGVWEESLGLDPRREAEPRGLIAEARAAGNVLPLLPLSGEGVAPAVKERPRKRPGAKRLAIAAAVLLSVGFAAMMILSQRNLYSTDIAEQRSLVLPDGTTVQLNSQTAVRVVFAATSRRVELIRGQALFDVRSDPTRPFEVESGGTRVRAIGTQFDVYRKRAGTVVTVLEGRVAVANEGLAAATCGKSGGAEEEKDTRVIPGTDCETLLAAGEQVVVASRAPARPVRADVAAATAWTRRKLVFEETPLAEAVEEMNRYSTRRLVIEDPHLEDFHIRGTFTTSDPEPLVQFLQKRFGFSVQQNDHEIRLFRDPQS